MADRGETRLAAWEAALALPLLEGRYCPSAILPPIPLPTRVTALCLPLQDCVAMMVDVGTYPLAKLFFDPDNIFFIPLDSFLTNNTSSLNLNPCYITKWILLYDT